MSSIVVSTVQTSLVNTAAGDLLVSPAGSNVSFNNKNLTNVASVNGTATSNLLSLTGSAPSANQVPSFSGTGTQVHTTPVTASVSGDVAGVRDLATTRNVVIGGNLTVRGDITYVNSQNVIVKDRYIELGAGDVSSSPQSGGTVLIQNSVVQTFTLTLPSGATFVPGSLPSTPPTVSCTFSGTITPGSLLQITGTVYNDGLYEAQSATANLLTIRGVGGVATTDGFTVTNFTAEVLASPVVPAQVNVAVLDVGTDGRLSVVSGSNSDGMSTRRVLSYASPATPNNTYLLTSTNGSSDVTRSAIITDSATGNTTLPAGAKITFTSAASGTVGVAASASATTSYNMSLPTQQGAANTVLTNDGTGATAWTAPGSSGVGNVIGPASSVDNSLPRFDGTTGRLLQTSAAVVDDSGNLSAASFAGALTSLTRPDNTTVTLAVKRAGDANNRFQSNSDGLLSWGVGASAPDTTLRRTNANEVKVSDATGTTPGSVIAASLKNDAGSGSVAVDASGAVTVTGNTSIALSATKVSLPDWLEWGANSVNGKMVRTAPNRWEFQEQDGTSDATVLKVGTVTIPGATSGAVDVSSPSVVTGYSVKLPAAQGAANTVLTNDGSGNLSWLTNGDVFGPASATDGAFPRFDGTTGKLIKDTPKVIGTDTGNVALTGVVFHGGTPGTTLVNLTTQAGTTVYTLRFPTAQGSSGQVMTNDGSGNLSWTTNGGGNVTGPASATDNALTRFDATTGKVIQNSGVILDDSNVMSWNGDVTLRRVGANNLKIADASGSVNGTLDLRKIQNGGFVDIAPAGNMVIAAAGSFLVQFNNSAALNNGLFMQWNGLTSGNVKLSAADTTTTYSMKLPAAQGASSQVMVNDGSGNLSWSLHPAYTATTTATIGDANGVLPSLTISYQRIGNVMTIGWTGNAANATNSGSALYSLGIIGYVPLGGSTQKIPVFVTNNSSTFAGTCSVYAIINGTVFLEFSPNGGFTNGTPCAILPGTISVYT